MDRDCLQKHVGVVRHWNILPSKIRDGPFKCSSPGWIVLGATWSGGRPVAGRLELDDL